jgi:hypothetical protein
VSAWCAQRGRLHCRGTRRESITQIGQGFGIHDTAM